MQSRTRVSWCGTTRHTTTQSAVFARRPFRHKMKTNSRMASPWRFPGKVERDVLAHRIPQMKSRSAKLVLLRRRRRSLAQADARQRAIERVSGGASEAPVLLGRLCMRGIVGSDFWGGLQPRTLLRVRREREWRVHDSSRMPGCWSLGRLVACQRHQRSRRLWPECAGLPGAYGTGENGPCPSQGLACDYAQGRCACVGGCLTEAGTPGSCIP
jgi:hypothetical protein